MVKSKNLLGNKVLLLLAFVLFAIGFSIINNVFLVFGQTSYPQWRGTSNIKAPYLAENLEYLNNVINSIRFQCDVYENSCYSGWCSSECPADTFVTGGGYYSYWGENMDFDGPVGNGWTIGEVWRGGPPVRVFAICCKLSR